MLIPVVILVSMRAFPTGAPPPRLARALSQSPMSQIEAGLTMLRNSHGELESMVPIRRSGVHHRGFGHGVGHDPRTRLPLFRPCTKKISTQYDLGLYGLFHYRHIPMVLLGILAGLFSHGKERIHWRPSTFWSYEYTGCAESRLSPDPGAPVQLLSGMIPCCVSCYTC